MKFNSRRRPSSKANLSTRQRLGVAAVEMAIVSPLLLLMIFMMIEASRFLSSLHATAGAAREVARLVAVAGVDDDTALEQAKRVMEHSLFGSDTVEVTITTEASDVPDFNLVNVEVSIDYSEVSVIGDPFNLGVTDIRGFASRLSEQ